MNEVALYYVAIVKNDYVCSLVAGPFFTEELAEESKSKLPEPGGACYLSVVEHEMMVRIA